MIDNAAGAEWNRLYVAAISVSGPPRRRTAGIISPLARGAIVPADRRTFRTGTGIIRDVPIVKIIGGAAIGELPGKGSIVDDLPGR